MGKDFFLYDHLRFRYEPFPIGIAKPLMDEAVYQELLKSYPPQGIFAYLPKVGHKYSLSEKYNGREYQDFIRSSPAWRELHGWIKSDGFIFGVMSALKTRYIKNIARGRLRPGAARLSTRFEFSMLPADGGHIVPHTDLPSKVVTLIVSMVGEGEWDPSFGGGTDVNQPKDVRHSFNQLNRQAPFEDMEVLGTYEFTPNQAVVFVKTFNSWHSVRPMTGHGSSAMRKTLTINIEARP